MGDARASSTTGLAASRCRPGGSGPVAAAAESLQPRFQSEAVCRRSRPLLPQAAYHYPQPPPAPPTTAPWMLLHRPGFAHSPCLQQAAGSCPWLAATGRGGWQRPAAVCCPRRLGGGCQRPPRSAPTRRLAAATAAAGRGPPPAGGDDGPILAMLELPQRQNLWLARCRACRRPEPKQHASACLRPAAGNFASHCVKR